MTTKAPSAVKPAADATLEKSVYAAVEGVPTVDAHDRDRLGYCVYLFLKNRRDTLEEAVRNAGSHLTVSHDEAVRIIRDRLRAAGIEV